MKNFFFFFVFTGFLSIFLFVIPKKDFFEYSFFSSIQFKGLGFSLSPSQTKEMLEDEIRDISRLGANSILIKIEENQKDWKSSSIFPNPETTVSLQTIEGALLYLNKKKIISILMPIITLKDTPSPKHWRGMIQPKEVPRWFDSYRSMILKYSRLAQRTQTDFFCIGSELVSMEKYKENWKYLISEVRKIFKGKILYSANWDHLPQGEVWKDLDVLGCNLYFSIAEKNETPDFKKMKTNWLKIKKDIFRWAKYFEKPILITEIGYPSRKDGLWDPWDHTAKGTLSHETQFLGYQAFLEVWDSFPKPIGILFYEWSSSTSSENLGYTPKGKPAENLLRSWFSETKRRE